MILLLPENIENKAIFSEFELKLLKKIDINDTDRIYDTLEAIDKYICEKYNAPAICMVSKLENEDMKILNLKDKIYQYFQRLT